MNYKNKVLLVLLIFANASNSLAASTADLKVIGTIIPAACTPVFAGGGVIDYGKISASDLSGSLMTAFPSRQIAYTITCDAPIIIATSWVDVRQSSSLAVSDEAFGLGLQGTNKIGFYTIELVPAKIMGDGTAADVIFAEGDVAIWASSAINSDYITHGARNRIFSYAAPGTLTPKAYTVYSGALSVSARVARIAEMDMTTPIVFDGLSTMEVRYL